VSGTVQVVPWDDSWPEAFRRERDRLAELLGPAASVIHHIGSTSVPGLCSKPVLDLLVETPDLASIDRMEPGLAALGYVAKGEYGIVGRRYFSRPAGVELKTHLHAFRTGDPAVLRHLLFRDHLRSHPEVAGEYGALKRRLADAHAQDPEAYQAGKSAFISRIETSAGTSRAATSRP
jgi:GrpB-like predicted nucleotidyltransferase (UPF0157 family)